MNLPKLSVAEPIDGWVFNTETLANCMGSEVILSVTTPVTTWRDWATTALMLISKSKEEKILRII
jgi:hypothetical protein